MFGWRKEKRHKRHEHKATRKEEKKKGLRCRKVAENIAETRRSVYCELGFFFADVSTKCPTNRKKKAMPKKKKKAKKESELVGTGNSHFHLHLFCCFCFVVRAELFFLLGGGCCCFFFVVVAAVAAVAAVLVVVVSLLKER